MDQLYKHPKTPDWFDNEKYLSLSEITLLNLLDMVGIRLELDNIARLQDLDVFQPYIRFFESPIQATTEFNYSFNSINPSALAEGEFVFPDNFEVNGMFPSIRLHSRYSKNIRVGTLWGNSVGDIDNGSLKGLFVDISAPEPVLKKAFESWLRAAKKEFSQSVEKIPKQSFESEKKRIIEHKLLQYIDLKIWFTLNAIDFNDSDMAYILFPYEKDSEHIRKTVRPNAEKLCSFYYRMWLEHQVGNKNH